MKVEITGRVLELGEPFETKNGKMQEVVLVKKFINPETDETAENYYPVSLAPELTGKYQLNDKLKVTGYINGRKSDQGKWFCSIYVRKAEKVK